MPRILDVITSWLRPRPAHPARSIRTALRLLGPEDLERADWPLSIPLTVEQSAASETDSSELTRLFDGDHAVPRFLGLLTPAALVHVLDVCGVLEHVRQFGYAPRVLVEIGHPLGDRVRLVDDDFPNPLCEIRLRRLRRTIPAALRVIEPPNAIDLLGVEWLSTQNPRKPFTAERSPLPGQEHPGLGLGRHVAELLRIASRRLGTEGVLNRPRYYHNAELYSRRFRYLDPRHEGWLRAVRRDLGQCDLAERTWIIERGRLRRAGSREVLRFWEGEQVMPTARRLSRGFSGKRYRQAVVEAADEIRFEVSD